MRKDKLGWNLTRTRNRSIALALTLLILGSTSLDAAHSAEPFVGRWALTPPGGGAAWLMIEDKGTYLDGSIMWRGGSVNGLESVFVVDDRLFVTRLNKVERKDQDDKVIRTHNFTETIIARVSGDTLELMRLLPQHNGRGVIQEEFTGKRIPPLPSPPELSKATRGKPIELFNGKDLTGWRLTDQTKDWKNGWSVEDGVLINDPVQPEDSHIRYGNLRTIDEFEDFNLTLEFNVGEGMNSGVYLRGIYEVQINDAYGKEPTVQTAGAIYSRIPPSENAARPPGEWQSYDITLLDRHVTVIHNGKTVVDNQPLLGCTGGALWSDEFRPGPIYLQGDHTAVKYRNMVLTPLNP